MKVSEDMWKYLQERLGYSDEEMKLFRANPRNEDIISKAPALMNKTVVIEVVDSHGCNSQHKVGDKFYFDGAGNLLAKLCPKKICFSVLNSAAPLIYAASELFYAGVDPNEMRFKRVGCGDVGVNCGGWGHIAMELSVEERKKE
ncbi:MAG: TIGR04076 family protein [Dehalococcoidia bacterium]|nr:TIGR04076 family protein [Dehalococcoidia bacterium]